MAKKPPEIGPTLTAGDALAGTYAFRFDGFERKAENARHLVGIGRLILSFDDRRQLHTLSGYQLATNNPMWTEVGEANDQPGLRHSEYRLDGTCTVKDPTLPIVAELEIRFTRTGPGPIRNELYDTIKILQSGVGRFWFISTNPRKERASDTLQKVDECVVGEMTRIE